MLVGLYHVYRKSDANLITNTYEIHVNPCNHVSELVPISTAMNFDEMMRCLILQIETQLCTYFEKD